MKKKAKRNLKKVNKKEMKKIKGGLSPEERADAIKKGVTRAEEMIKEGL